MTEKITLERLEALGFDKCIPSEAVPCNCERCPTCDATTVCAACKHCTRCDSHTPPDCPGCPQQDAALSFYVGCSQCEALAINGVACHEHGCPNATHECEECDAPIKRGFRLCESCSNPPDYDEEDF